MRRPPFVDRQIEENVRKDRNTMFAIFLIFDVRQGNRKCRNAAQHTYLSKRDDSDRYIVVRVLQFSHC